MSEATRAPDERVVVDRPETMNLLGLLMKGLLAENLANESKYAKARKLKGDVQVQAGQMIITLRFGDGLLTILCGPTDKPRARVKGEMAALLGVVLGKWGFIMRKALKGGIFPGGNVFFLLKILPLISEPK